VFGELYAHYHKSLIAFCLGKVGSLPQAENVASDTLIKLLQHEKPEEIENFESWLFSVAKNECLTYLSKTNRRKKLLDANYQVINNHLPEVEILFSMENMDQIIRSTLVEKDYQIWQLHQQGYDNQEIAEIVGATEKTVANRKSAARAKLKEVFKKLNR
ncbi:MAG: sigma-70 family RNA polymerase sigma factor, partial [Ekhidna sp.]